MGAYSDAVENARGYYNSGDADSFYATIWGGEDIHVGLYQSPEESIFDASLRTVERITGMLQLSEGSRVLDIGAGYGGAARHLVKHFGCRVDCLNLSEVQNERNRRLNVEQGLSDRIEVMDGSFEAIPGADNVYDVVWSQDSILHAGNRRKVFEEVARVLKPGGEFIFTDPMQTDDCPDGVLQPILDRIHLDSLGSPGYYIEVAHALGMELVERVDLPEYLPMHYSRVKQEIETREGDLRQVCSQNYIDRMKKGLGHWVDGGRNGFLTWGILHFRLRAN